MKIVWFMGITLLMACSPSSRQRDWIELEMDPGFSDWQTEVGDWQSAGDVKLMSGDSTHLAPVTGTGVGWNGPSGRTVHLFSDFMHSSCELEVEFKVAKNSNSGIYLMGRYEVQVLDSYGEKDLRHADVGGIYQRWQDGKGFEGHPPMVNASLPPGQWQTFYIRFCAPKFNEQGEKIKDAEFPEVRLNGQLVQQNVKVTGPTRSAAFENEEPLGPLMLQGDHGPVAYRNIRLRPVECN
jgi:hypothetical protein